MYRLFSLSCQPNFYLGDDVICTIVRINALYLLLDYVMQLACDVICELVANGVRNLLAEHATFIKSVIRVIYLIACSKQYFSSQYSL